MLVPYRRQPRGRQSGQRQQKQRQPPWRRPCGGRNRILPLHVNFFNKLAPRTVQFINLGSTDYPAFFLQGSQFLKLVIRQCLGVKGIEIVSVVLCIGCSFYKNQKFSFLTFGQFSQKEEILFHFCQKHTSKPHKLNVATNFSCGNGLNGEFWTCLSAPPPRHEATKC